MQAKLPLMNPQQTRLYEGVMRAADGQPPLQGQRRSKAFFVYSPGGCGKTFMFNLQLSSIRSQGKIALAVASSGIASLLMDGASSWMDNCALPLQDPH